MNYILLSGGSGKRLWPLSNDVRSKQFLKLFSKRDGSYESMLQRMYRMIRIVDENASVTVAASESQVEAINNQIGNDAVISVEPCRRDTFPAIALATAFLHDVRGIHEDEVVVVCPVDPYVETDYFEQLKELAFETEKTSANLVLMGIQPSYASAKYGYIIPCCKEPISTIRSFKEKPDIPTAEQYINQGALWNAGVFSFRLKYVLRIAREVFGYCDYKTLFSNYDNLPRISFDYAVVEKEKDIRVMRFNGIWKDLGTWDALIGVLDKDTIGRVYKGEACKETYVINEMDVPIVVNGTNKTIVAASPDGILVTDLDLCESLKKHVEVIQQQPMYEEMRWGRSTVIDHMDRQNEQSYITRKLEIMSEQRMKGGGTTDEKKILNVVQGSGTIEFAGRVQAFCCGDVKRIPPTTCYEIYAKEKMIIIEVSME